MKIGFRVWILIAALVLALIIISPKLSSNVIVKSVDQDSLAFEQGIRPGMTINSINGYQINSLEDYSEAVEKIFASGENETRVSILTDQSTFIFFTKDISDISVGMSPHSKIKTGLDLSGGARAVIRPANTSFSEAEIQDLVAITTQRLNAFGLSDITVRPTRDLEGNNFMVVEIAGATPEDIRGILAEQGKFEARVGNATVFEGGEKDISNVCRSDASCASLTGCYPSQDGSYFCNFMFAVYLKESAAQRHADVTGRLSLDDTGNYLNESLVLLVDDRVVDELRISSDLRGQVTTQVSVQGSGSGATLEDAQKNARENMNKLQTVLITGSLPYKLEIVKMDTISPSLGEEFTRSILLLGIVAFIAVSAAIFVRYRRIKVSLAVIMTMVSEVLLTLGVAALIGWNLDAAAIAGIIIGIGTGVNDQIVIIEEAVSKNERESVKERVKRALFIIVGAFLTIVAAMLPLFWAGAGLLRGFALTTIIGVSVGILITRPAFAEIVRKIEA